MSTQQFKIHRVTALPEPLEAYAVYLVAPPGVEDYVEMYVVNSTGTKARRIIKESDIKTLIDTAIQDKVKPISEIRVVADGKALGELDSTAVFAYVKDAKTVPGSEVKDGGATFIRDGLSWVKVAEAESLDVVLKWDDIQGKPSASKEDIDDAVTKKHTHTNKTQLDKVDEDENGNFTYGGNPVATAWSTTAW